jgi:hypothetical protein
MNSRNGKEAEEKVLGIAIDQVAGKLVGSGTVLTGLQMAHSYFNNTARGLHEMANIEYKEMLYNRRQYGLTQDEVYLKRESSASRRMHEYLNKMQEILDEK